MLSDKINGIELKVKQLAGRLEKLQKENAALLKENTELKGNLNLEIDKSGKMDNKLAQLKQTLSQRQETDKPSSKHLRKEIEQYIKEIDKCIEWLKNS